MKRSRLPNPTLQNPKKLKKEVKLCNHIPNDIIDNILLRLPVKSLSRFRCVCKRWCDFISNPNFIKKHTDYGVQNEKYMRLMLIRGHKIYSSVGYFDSSSPLTCYDREVKIDFPRNSREFQLEADLVRIRGSCNGLLLIATPHHWDCSDSLLSLWNPCTTEYKKIREPPYYDDGLDFLDDIDASINENCLDDVFEDVAHGFGYDCKIEDYKLVRVSTFGGYLDCDSEEILYFGCKVKIYRLGTNSWKHISFIFPYHIAPSGGVLVNGVLHWRATQWSRGIQGSEAIVSFDFEHERFVDVSPPAEHIDNELFIGSTLRNLGGRLCLFGECSFTDCIEVWVMNDYGVRESWTKQFTIALQSLVRCSLRPVHFLKTGEILLSIGPNDRHSNLDQYELALYHPKHEKLRTLIIPGGQWSEAHTYVESLVSLKTGTYLSH